MEARPEIHPLFFENQRRKRIESKQVLLCPGPVNTTERVKTALMHPDIGHREEEFSELLDAARHKLSLVFGVKDHSKYTTVVVSGSGSAANEAVLSSIGADTKVLVLSNGEFGERLADLAELHGLQVVSLQLRWGEPLQLSEVERTIQEEDPDLIAMVHHETATGMLNPIGEVGKLTEQYGKLLYVDAVSSLGADFVDVEDNHIDLCTASSNKALAGVCGMSFVCGRVEVFERLKHVKSRTSYLNLYRHYDYQTRLSQTPNTPSLTVLFAIDAALDDLLEAGLENTVYHRRQIAQVAREELKAAGLRFVVPEELTSNVLTTCYLPEGIDYQDLRSKLKERGYVVYGGKGPLDNKVFQVATIGAVTEDQVRAFVRDLKWTLSMLGTMAKARELGEDRPVRSVPRLSTT